MNKLKNKVRDQDIFGHSVQLVFNKESEQSVSLCGGSASILVKLLLIYLMIQKIIDISSGSQDKLGYFEEQIDADSDIKLDLSEQDFLFYF